MSQTICLLLLENLHSTGKCGWIASGSLGRLMVSGLARDGRNGRDMGFNARFACLFGFYTLETFS